MSLNREISTDEYLGTFKQSTEKGEKRERVLSLVDKLYRDGAIDMEQWTACGMLRNMIMMEIAPSEGVSSYGQSVRASDPTSKADRRGKLYTGFIVEPDGSLTYAGGRKSRRNERCLEDAIFAAVGLHDLSGVRRVNVTHAQVLMRIVCDTEQMPTLTEITRQLTSYYTGAKQMPPFATGVITIWLERLARHFREAERRG